IRQAAISKMENGEKQIDYKTMKKLVDIFQVNINWLLTGEGPKRISGINEPKDGGIISGSFADIKEWLQDEKNKKDEDESDEDIDTWFFIQFKNTFPQFKEWLKKRNQARDEINNRRAA
ncbi:MAG: helix-turn-helix domain-containing protein, partial [Nanoarchaeota archaeon]|nr:helix-turn-helix domain-containing protein [Nanoarchaeota archaeon]